MTTTSFAAGGDFQMQLSRFHDEYLANLRERHAYECKKQNRRTSDVITEGDVVLIHEKDLPRISWKMGIVETLHRGKDGLTRAAAVRTTNGVSNRAVAKLYPLELNVGISRTPTTENELSIPTRRSVRNAAQKAKQRIQNYYEL